MSLEPDETRSGVSLAACRIGVEEVGLLLTVQENRETIVPDQNLVLVPLSGRIGHDTLVERLVADVVDRPRGAKLLVDVLARRRAAPAERVDLNFESEINADERPVVVVDVRGRRVWKA